MSFRFSIFLLLSNLGLCLPLGSLMAQNPRNLQEFDAKIAHFQTTGQPDSFRYYSEQKCRRARELDSLERWAWQRFDAYEAFELRPEEALQWLDKSLEQRWREPRNAQEWYPFVYIQATRGWYLFELGKVFQSIQAYETAEQLYRQYRYADFDALELIYKPLGAKYVRLGDNDKAIAIFQRGLQLGGDNEGLAGLYCDIGIAYWNQEDYVASEENYRRGLSLPGISAAKRALLLGALAQTELDKGQLKEAASLAAQSLQLLQNIQEKDPILPYRCYSRRTAGIASTRLGRYREADALLSGALKDAQAAFGPHSRDAGKIEVARAQWCLAQGRGNAALEAANRALSEVLPGSFEANPDPALFYEENTIFEALAVKADAAQWLYESSGQIVWLERAMQCHELAWQAESLLRKVYQYSSSKLKLQKASREREESALNVTRLLFEKTGQVQWLEKAILLVERSKATLLLETMQDNLFRQGLAGSDPRFTELNALRQSLSYFEKKILLEPQSPQIPSWLIEADAIREKIRPLEQILQKDYPKIVRLDANTIGLPLPGDFSSGEALVEYFMSDQWLDIFVFQKNQTTVWRRIPNQTALKDLIRRYLAYFQNDFAILNDPEGYFKTAYALCQTILPPESAQATQLTILPDGALHFVPFEALLTSLEGSPTLRNAAYLIRKQTIRYGWSLAVLRQQKSIHSQASGYLLSLAPGFSNGERGLSPLTTIDFPWGGIHGWNVQPLKGQNATLQHFLNLSGQYRVLHFSTHAFASGNPRIELIDGSLLLPDLYALPLQADLVVLSACETGLGKDEKGEGVMSLARAFAQAGAACIVSSLWSVNDHSTARLLQLFYQKIGQGHSTVSALREAKLAYLSDTELGIAEQSPYFWAGLVAVGDDRDMQIPWGWKQAGILFAGILGLLLLVWKRWRIAKTSTRT